MPGRKLVLTSAFTDTTLPKLKIDPVLPDNGGALLLIDPMHPANAWATGVPASASLVPNIAAAQAAAVYGGTPETRPTITYANLSGTDGKVERTSKGGLHVIVSQQDSYISQSNSALLPQLGINWPAAFRALMFSAPTDDIYVSVWSRITRARRAGTIGDRTGASYVPQAQIFTASSNQRLQVGGSNLLRDSLGQRNPADSATGPTFGNGASSSWSPSTAPTSSTQTQDTGLTIGAMGANGTFNTSPSTARSRWPSWVFYRLYVEDLTVSGRSYAQVDALDFAEYTKQVLTVGGRYYSDTVPTDPSTIA